MGFLISLVVPTRNRKEKLQRLLESIFLDFYYNDIIEVCVVSDGLGFDPAIIDCWGERCLLEVVPFGGAGAARNFGVSKTSGKWIYFVDDDCVMPNDWCRGILDAIRKGEDIGLLGGDVRPLGSKGVCGKYLTLVRHLSGPLFENGRIVSIATANMLVHRECFELIGGFDERLVEGSEDANLVWRMWDVAKINFCWNFFVFHDHDVSLLGFMEKFYRYGYSYSKHLRLVEKGVADDGVYFVFSKLSVTVIVRSLNKIIVKPIERLKTNNLSLIKSIIFYPLSLIQEIAFISGCFACSLQKKNLQEKI